jgi:hypothetical protein
VARLRDCQAPAWARLHLELLRQLNATGQLDWSLGVVDGSYGSIPRFVA